MAHDIQTMLGYHGNEIRFYDELLGGKGAVAQRRAARACSICWRPLSAPARGAGRARVPPGAGPGDDDARARRRSCSSATRVPPYVRVVPGAAKLPEDQIVPTVIDPRFPYDRVALYPDTAGADARADPGRARCPDRAPSRPRSPTGRRAGCAITLDGCRAEADLSRRRRELVSRLARRRWTGSRRRCYRADHTLLSVVAPAGRAGGHGSGSPPRPIARGKLVTLAGAAADAGAAGRAALASPAERGAWLSGRVVVIPTYNERINLPLIVPQILQQDPRLEVLVVDDNSPDGTGAAGRRARGGRAADPRAAPAREGRAGEGLPRRLPVGPRARVRPDLRDGRRLQPRPQVPAGVPARHRARRPRPRLALSRPAST